MHSTGKKKILLFGGSFNPPHSGHAALLRAALKKLRPDLALLLPAYHSPLKAEPETAPQTRLELLRIFLKSCFTARERAILRIDCAELKSGRKVYTWQTLRRLSKEYPGAAIYLLIGSDCLAEFNRWKRPGEVARRAVLTVGRRPGAELPSKTPYRFIKLPGTFPEAASSQLQLEMLLTGKIPGQVPPQVARAIRAKGLYGLALHERLRSLLDSYRYRHSLAVGKLAAALAVRHGAPPLDAAKAGLLHDCAKALPVPKKTAYARLRLSASDLKLLQKHAPCLLHAAAGAELARREFGASNPLLLQAIHRHALGAVDMTLLDKIIFLSDMASEDRHFPETASLRELAFANLDTAMLAASTVKLRTLLESGRWIAPQGLELWNALIDKSRCC
ncbi:MAG: HD domain-containing protein [Elusimicrobia bacterium]|nr:HD domain-containing protein [Elusimicrobiota bacterium]